ncbi:uncharacterized protein LOC124384893 isoform X1 [Silurus meridionalis]|uniref:uncharacterized protein LOC124384893 isoform X1 n=1 Tax=Silurus meridionalis TaxID=175797 RepID=UPI001EEC8BBF|nr:uncharacterized protein LOC124384893 isoform X1 [Silurus meridionalis]
MNREKSEHSNTNVVLTRDEVKPEQMGSFYRNEEDDESLMQNSTEEETKITPVIAQAEAEQCQEFCPSSMKHRLLQLQSVASFQRPCPNSLNEGSTQKRNSEFGHSPKAEKSYSSIVSPSIRRLEVSCCSDIYTSFGGSQSHSESVYIYAESIKGCDTSCSNVSENWGLICLYTEVENTTQVPRSETAKLDSSIEALFGSESSCNDESVSGDCDSDSSGVNADWEQSLDSDNDSCNSVSSFARAQWGSASTCSGSAASGNITHCDLNSSFSITEQNGGSFSKHITAGNYDPSIGQLKEKHFKGGHHGLPVSNFKPEHHNLLVGHFVRAHCDSSVDHFDRGHCESPVDHFDGGHCDTPVDHFNRGHCESPVDHFSGGHCDFPVGHFDGHCEFPVNHFYGGHCNSSVSHFEVDCQNLPVGHFEVGHPDFPVGHFEAGHCSLPDGQIDEAHCDLYNDFSESRGPVCYRAKEHDHFHFKDNSELTWRKLQGVVTHPDRYRVAPFFHEMMNEAERDRNQDNHVKINKGFLFHPQRFLQARNTEYREGHEYSMLRHVQNGSYGDVFSVRDKQTGYTCAAKKIPLSCFSWEEVRTWSRLDSPRVLQLYGAVQEGLNVILFMDLKTGSLAQFLKASGHFAEDLALYYHHQVLQALEHLHSRNVIHLDVKVDNVLLSKDKRYCFLCDFGLSETLDQTGYSTKTFRGNGLRGTESHMSPEVARGDPRSDKADVWSSCCMLLHMLSGHQPWTRYYTHPLCLKIVSEPAPLWEIPFGCDPLTCHVIKGGLVKEPRKRDSARELLKKSSRALCSVGSPFDLVQSATQTLPYAKTSPPMPTPNALTNPLLVPPPVSITTEKRSAPRIQWVSRWREQAAEEDENDSEDTYEDSNGGMDRTERWMEKYWGLGKEYTLTENQNDTDEETKSLSEEGWREIAAAEERNEEEEESDEEIESDLGSLRELGSKGEWEPFLHLQILFGSKQQNSGDEWSEQDGDCVPSLMTSSNDLNLCERLTLACHRSICTSDVDSTYKGSDWSDDLSSGVFSSYSSLPDEQSFNVDWSVSTNQPPSCRFEGFGVDIWVEDVNGDTFRIRERRKVKLGHVAMGISAQISISAFSLATLDGKQVSHDTEVLESGMWLLCVSAADSSTSWTWRIRDGKMEVQEADGLQSDTCSTIAA